MKLHPPVLRACTETLYGVFFKNLHAEKLVDIQLKSQKKWGARDRRQFAGVVYDVVRWWRRALYLADIQESDLRGKSPEEVDVLLRQLVEYVVSNKEILNSSNWSPTGVSRAVQASISDDMDQWGESEIGADWEKLVRALNTHAPQFLRVNELKMDRKQLLYKLGVEGIEAEIVPSVPSALKLKERKNVFITEAFKSGFFEMQDAGSQQIAPFLQVEPGHRVVDACAGAGGKSLHLAALMQNKGQIIALDVHESKLNELKLRARRAGVHIIETRLIESTKVIKRLHESADRLLLDVPCSGLGVLRRHPDTKWKWSLANLNETLKLQFEILSQYSQILKSGGKLVYATCSVMPSENQKQIQKFLQSTEGQFLLEDELFISPRDTEFDGFYAARLVKK